MEKTGRKKKQLTAGMNPFSIHDEGKGQGQIDWARKRGELLKGNWGRKRPFGLEEGGVVAWVKTRWGPFRCKDKEKKGLNGKSKEPVRN